MKEIEIEKIKADPNQPRKHFDEAGIKALAETIEKDGLLQPIVVKPAEDGNYHLVIGERRLRACKSLGWKSIKCLITKSKETFVLSLVENVQREDLSPIEEAEAYRKLLDSGLSQDELGKRIGKSQSQIAQKLALLKLPPKAQSYLRSKEITEGHGQQLLKFQKLLDGFEFSNLDGEFSAEEIESVMERWAFWTSDLKLSVSKLKELIRDVFIELVIWGHPFYGDNYHRLLGGRVKVKSEYHGYLNLLRAFKLSLERGDPWEEDEDEEGKSIYLDETGRLLKIDYFEKRIREVEAWIKEDKSLNV